MNVNEILAKNGSFVLPGTSQQNRFRCAVCSSSHVQLVLREEEHKLYIRLECTICSNYIETGLVSNAHT